MKSELLTRIKEAETAANSRVQAAESEAKQIVAEARRQADAILADARQQADFAHQSRLDAARAAAEKASATEVAKGKKSAEALRKKYESGVTGATDRVLKLLEAKLG